MNSFNHYSLGSVGQWLYQYVAGIDTDPAQPGYKHILLHPHPGPGLTQARAAYDSIHGPIVSDWKHGRWTVCLECHDPAEHHGDCLDPSRQTPRRCGKAAEKSAPPRASRRLRWNEASRFMSCRPARTIFKPLRPNSLGQ